MKVVYDPGEKEQLEKIHSQYGKFVFGDESKGKTYGLTFNVTNPAIAEYVLTGLLNSNLKDFDMGIEMKNNEYDVVGARRSELKRENMEYIDKPLWYWKKKKK